MNIDQFETQLQSSLNSYDWYNSVGLENQRVVVYVNYMNSEVLTTIPQTIENHQVLVHYAKYRDAKPSDFITQESSPSLVQEQISQIDDSLQALIQSYGLGVIDDIFFEIHDKENALTNLAPKFPEAHARLSELYQEYGFDILFELLETDSE